MSMIAFEHAAAAAPLYLSGGETAQAVGLSWERFRKVRADWTRDRDFPAEINDPGEPVRYLTAAVYRWIERRSRRVHLPAETPRTAQAADTETALARRGRSQLKLLKGGAPC